MSEKTGLLQGNKRETYSPSKISTQAHDKEAEINIQALDEEADEELFVVVAGKSGNGKSTALRNIFDCEFEASCQVNSVTKVFKMLQSRKKGRVVNVIDTPGFRSLDIKSKQIADAVSLLEKKIGKDYILLYCVSVCPPGKITEEDLDIVKTLHSHMGGTRVWDKCVLLFTFCDNLRHSIKKEEAAYIQHLSDNATQFSTLIKRCKAAADISVRTIFEKEKKVEKEIVAVPVGQNKKNEDDIMPGIVNINKDWTDTVIDQIIDKTRDERKKRGWKRFKGEILVGGTLPSCILGGAALGAGIGAAAGMPGTPIGMTVGAAGGAGIGAAAGLVIGSVSTAAGGLVMHKRKKAAKKLLPEELK